MSFPLPVGVILPYGGVLEEANLPKEWLPCDGRLVCREQFSELYMAVRGAYGETGTDFNLPDLRGRFLRGVSGESDRDPERGSRTAMQPGGNVGNLLGSVQGDTAHYQYPKRKRLVFTWHDTKEEVTLPDEGLSQNFLVHRGDSLGPWAGFRVDSSIEKVNQETRPKNAYVHFIIKVR